MTKISIKGRFTGIIVCLLSVIFVSCSQVKHSAHRNMTVVFYNVENLFDTENTPGTRDGEFTPEGSNKWDEPRYNKKLDDLAKVISGINEADLPEIVGLCEVENEKVILDLVQTGSLANGNYRVVHYESPDLRGIDCALVYRPDEFNVMYHRPVPVYFADAPSSKTRDILYVKGQTRNREEFHIFVTHWPSRIGGVEQTEPKRLVAASVLKGMIDSVQAVSPRAQIIILGDMNDEPDNRSLAEVIGAGHPSGVNGGLINMMYPDFMDGYGSYNYRGNWDMLDNIVVSAALFRRRGWRITGDKGYIFRKEWMEYTSPKGLVSPNRTYGGSDYLGGVSDHFPVYIRLRR